MSPELHMHTKLKQALLLAAVGLLCSVWAASSVFAAQGFYGIDKNIRTGMLVSLTKNPGVVEPASNNNAAELVGVVGTSQTDLTVQQGQIAVQTDGVVQTLVSTVSGDIAVGDKISPSSINGFGAKAGPNGWVVGTAQGSLAPDTKDAVKTTITDANNVSREVYVATIPVLVNVTYNSADQQIEGVRLALPESLQELADSVAGKRATPTAVILGFLLLFIGLCIAGIILNTVIRNGIQSIARQPLSKKDVIHSMSRSIIFAFSLLLVSVVGAIIVIKLF